MKIKVHEIIDLSNKISENYENLNLLQGPKFLYVISENIKLLNDEIIKLNEIIKGSDRYNEYQDKRISTCIKYSRKNEDGSPKMVINNGIEEFDIDQTEEFTAEIKELQAEYKEEIDEFMEQVRTYNNRLEEEIDINFKTISIDDIPENINFELMSVVTRFIEN